MRFELMVLSLAMQYTTARLDPTPPAYRTAATTTISAERDKQNDITIE